MLYFIKYIFYLTFFCQVVIPFDLLFFQAFCNYSASSFNCFLNTEDLSGLPALAMANNIYSIWQKDLQMELMSLLLNWSYLSTSLKFEPGFQFNGFVQEALSLLLNSAYLFTWRDWLYFLVNVVQPITPLSLFYCVNESCVYGEKSYTCYIRDGLVLLIKLLYTDLDDCEQLYLGEVLAYLVVDVSYVYT